MPDREKLIEIMADINCNDEYCKDCEFGNDIDGCVRRQKEIIADHLIANGVTIQKWIPVTERLPEEWVDVLVLSKFGFCEVAVYLGIPGKWRITWNHDLFEVDSITHWMPLPEPPKEGETP